MADPSRMPKDRTGRVLVTLSSLKVVFHVLFCSFLALFLGSIHMRNSLK